MDPSKGDAKIDLSQWSVRSNTTALHASVSTSSNVTVPLSFSLSSLPSSGTMRDAKGAITKTPYPISGSSLWYTPVACCTASTCTPDQVQQQHDSNNHTSFAYISSDVNSKAPLTVSLAVSCPSVTFVPQAAKGDKSTLAIQTINTPHLLSHSSFRHWCPYRHRDWRVRRRGGVYLWCATGGLPGSCFSHSLPLLLFLTPIAIFGSFFIPVSSKYFDRLF